MSRIEQLIAELCPDGVEFKELGKIGEFYGGLSGKSKNDFQDGNARFVTYMNVFSNITVKTDIDVFVKIGEDENQNRVEYGDVLFTGSSETPDECGMSSVLTEKFDEPLYLNSFCFGFRLYNEDLLLPDFSKYLFRDINIRKQISQTANGVTRFNISKKRFAKISIPIPPLPIQQEIVRILDTFTDLDAELQAELEARKKQYEHYRNQLLNFEGKEVEWKTLGDICEIGDGLHGTPEYSLNGDYFFINGNNLRNGNIVFDDKTKKVDTSVFLRHSINFMLNKTIFLSINGTIGNISFYNNEKIVLGKSVAYFNIANDILLKEYLYYLLQTEFAHTYFSGNLTGSTIKNLGLKSLRKFKIPIPPLPEQERIVSMLDKFEALVNEELSAEIDARRKQYEYYREKLLTFEPLVS